ncbi:MAG: T9SS type A sorting domain-containing protein [Cryomorphaceae bacterium]
MHYNHPYIALCAALLVAATSFGQGPTKLQAVSIIFTDAKANTTVDTVISSGENALNALLSSQGLSADNTHILNIDRFGPQEGKGDRKEIIVIESESAEDGKAPRRAEFIEIDGKRKTREELTPEERNLLHRDHAKGEADMRIEEEIENGKAVKKIWINGEEATEAELKAFEAELEQKMGDNLQKEIVMVEKSQKGGTQEDAEHMEVRIEEEMENGKAVKKIWINGKEASEAELKALEAKHQQGKGEKLQKEVVMIKDSEGARNEAGAEQMEVRIEDRNVNGQDKRMIWINGNEASEEELHALELEHEKSMGGKVEKEIILLDSKSGREIHEIRLEEESAAHSSGEMKAAIVIVRSVQSEAKAVSALALSTEFNLYPNPANDKVNLRFNPSIDGRYSVQVTSLDGKVVRQLNGNAKKRSTTEIDVNGLAPGTYIVTVGLAEGLLSSKLVIE